MSVLKSIFLVLYSECEVYVSAAGELGGECERDTSSQETSGSARGAEIGFFFCN